MGAGSQREMVSLFQQLTAVLVAVVPICRCNAQPLTPEVPGRDQKPRESRVVLHGQGTRDSRKHLNLEGADLEKWKETALKSLSQLCYISHADCNVPACDSPGGWGGPSSSSFPFLRSAWVFPSSAPAPHILCRRAREPPCAQLLPRHHVRGRDHSPSFCSPPTPSL